MWTNWSGALTGRPRAIDRPLDETGVVAAVRRAATRGQQLRPVGGGLSWSPLSLTDDVLVDCSALTGVVAVSADRVRVRAGATLHQVHAALAVRGRALAVVPDSTAMTVAGAVSTGTHGGGSTTGSLSAQVTGIRLVDGTGAVRQVAGDDLDAARTALGALGVLTEVELATVPAEPLHVHEEPGDPDALMAPGGVLDSHAWAEVELNLSTRTAVARRGDPAVPDSALPVRRRGPEALGRTISRLVPVLHRPPRWGGEAIGPAHELLPDPRPQRYEAVEWALPRPGLGAALRELRAAASAAGIELRSPVVVRVGPAETGWLHPAHGRVTAWVSFRSPRGADPGPLSGLASAVLGAAGGRPHWAAHHEWTQADVALAYPRLPDFLAVRERYDPDRRFAGPYLDALLGR